RRIRAAWRYASRASCATARTRARTSRIPSRPSGSCIGARWARRRRSRADLTRPPPWATLAGAMLFESPHPDIAIPDIVVHRFVLARAAALRDKPALIDAASGRTLTYGQLAGGADRVAAGLAARGFEPGEVLARFSTNCPAFVLAYHGT